MEWKECKTQAEVDAAVAAGHGVILHGSSSADLYDNSSAYLRGNSLAVLHDNSRAVLYGNSRAVLHGSSRADLYGNSRADLRNNSRADLYDNSSADLRDFATGYVLSDRAKIRAGSRATVIRPDYPTDPAAWAAMKLIPVKRGRMTLWKTTDMDGLSFHDRETAYTVGKTTTAKDWDADYTGECGCGLHLADSPESARWFVPRDTDFRLFAVTVALTDCRCYGGRPDCPQKLRARACRVVKEYPADWSRALKIKAGIAAVLAIILVLVR